MIYFKGKYIYVYILYLPYISVSFSLKVPITFGLVFFKSCRRMRNLQFFVVLFMAIFIVSGAKEMRMNQEKKTCPVYWPMVPCDAKKCEKMCLDFYGLQVSSSYCDKPGDPNAQCTVDNA
ncbi:hypothetical protein HID58_021539 [Brassica napus]|uniref:Uncharacterized protein n=1 Tax=Brassica napus TaxID=3708 RepID=A0ABQ8CWX4_BRANA|nr:hypothetical protein HID58_021539 [Brassica napus]